MASAQCRVAATRSAGGTPTTGWSAATVPIGMLRPLRNRAVAVGCGADPRSTVPYPHACTDRSSNRRATHKLISSGLIDSGGVGERGRLMSYQAGQGQTSRPRRHRARGGAPSAPAEAASACRPTCSPHDPQVPPSLKGSRVSHARRSALPLASCTWSGTPVWPYSLLPHANSFPSSASRYRRRTGLGVVRVGAGPEGRGVGWRASGRAEFRQHALVRANEVSALVTTLTTVGGRSKTRVQAPRRSVVPSPS